MTTRTSHQRVTAQVVVDLTGAPLTYGEIPVRATIHLESMHGHWVWQSVRLDCEYGPAVRYIPRDAPAWIGVVARAAENQLPPVKDLPIIPKDTEGDGYGTLTIDLGDV